jgi:hypothetical protein
MTAVKSKVRFDAVETKDGQWHVRATLLDGSQPQIDGFNTESEARRWIKAQSAVWLKMYERGKHP